MTEKEITEQLFTEFLQKLSAALNLTIDEAIKGKYKDSNHSGALIALQAFRRRWLEIDE